MPHIVCDYTHTQRHAFSPRRGRQRCTCTLRHVMPLYNVHPLFTILCYKSHVVGARLRATTENRKSEKSPVILCPTRESNPRPLVRQSPLRPLKYYKREQLVNY
uniref:SFRICE_014800 n=1 Tax=Spodoptera frugiperda TaxID=7108 RepID=A0A2H1VJC0_SPOFR